MIAEHHSGFIPRTALNEVAEALVAIGERFFEHSDRLNAKGFTAFLPYLEDDAAVCSEIDRSMHKRYLVEQAKEIVGTWGPRPVTLLGPTVGYHSSFLNQLREERAGQGFDFTYYKNNGPEIWRCQLSPCLMERERVLRTDAAVNQMLLERRNAARAAAWEQECRLIATGALSSFIDESEMQPPPGHWSRQRTLKMNTARQLARLLLAKELEEFGYTLSTLLSTNTWLTYVRQFENNWQLRFIFSISQNYLDSFLFFCHQSLPKRPTGDPLLLYDPEVHIEVRLKEASPYFHGAYYSHLDLDDWQLRRSLDRLEVNIRATLELYRAEHDYLMALFSKQSSSLAKSRF